MRSIENSKKSWDQLYDEYKTSGTFDPDIWLFLLCNLIEEKQLYSMPGAKGEDSAPHINPVVLTKSRVDAISFGEAMYQLIENACLHSANHQAWFGCKLHRAGRDVTMSRLGDEVNTRRRLYWKYRNCFVTKSPAASPLRKGWVRRAAQRMLPLNCFITEKPVNERRQRHGKKITQRTRICPDAAAPMRNMAA